MSFLGFELYIKIEPILMQWNPHAQVKTNRSQPAHENLRTKLVNIEKNEDF